MPTVHHSPEDPHDALYDVIVKREDRDSVRLAIPRTREEVAELRQKHTVIAIPHAPRQGSTFNAALQACATLYSHCEQTGNHQLKARAEKAIEALLAGSGVRNDDHPSSGVTRSAPSTQGRQQPLAAPTPEDRMRDRENTWPGIGGYDGKRGRR